jgi:hypothetical protein
MATIRLVREEAEDGDLPPVCMCCGEPATVLRAKNFSWHPDWVYLLLLLGLLPCLIAALIVTKRMRIRAPLCEEHKNHWLWRNWFAYGGLTGIFFLGVGVIALMLTWDDPQGQMSGLFGLLCFGLLGLGLAWLLAAFVVQNLGIRPIEITDRTITLRRVAPEFVDAVREEREYRRRESLEEEKRYRRYLQNEMENRFSNPRKPRRPENESFEEER